MKAAPRLLARIALFSALIYVLSWGTAYLPNVNLAFFIAFSAGYLWGVSPGLLVGAVGMGLWTSFNPYGPAALPVMAAQVLGMALCGLVGASFHSFVGLKTGGRSGALLLTVAGAICTLVFYLPVNLVDAWVFGPFWPRFVTGLVWLGISLVANMLIFPLLFGVTRKLYERERTVAW